MKKRKKIVILALIVVIIAAGVYKLFLSKDGLAEKMNDVTKNLTSYYTEANMQINNGEDSRNYFVTVSYQKDQENDNFRVSLLDKAINQQQLILKNAKGVYVLTPSLNQVYEFKGSWPLNSPKPYLYHSILDVIKGEHESKSLSDGYLLSNAPKYPNAPNWTKQEIKVTKDLRPLWVHIYNNDNEVDVKVTFTKVDINTSFSDDYFDVEANMREAINSNGTKVTAVYEDLPLMPVGIPVSATLRESSEIVDQKQHILTYEGDEPFTVVEYLATENEEMVVEPVDGELIDIYDGFAILTGNRLTYTYNGVTYEIYSNVLSTARLVAIANGMDIVTTK